MFILKDLEPQLKVTDGNTILRNLPIRRGQILFQYIFQKYPLTGRHWKKVFHKIAPEEAHLFFHILLIFDNDPVAKIRSIIDMAPHLKPYCGLRTLFALHHCVNPHILPKLLDAIGNFKNEHLYLSPDGCDTFLRSSEEIILFLNMIGIPKHIGHAESTLLMEAIGRKGIYRCRATRFDPLIQFLIDNHIDTSVQTSRGLPLHYFIYMLSSHLQQNNITETVFKENGLPLLLSYIRAFEEEGSSFHDEKTIFLNPLEAERQHSHAQRNHITEYLNFPLLSLFSIGHVSVPQFYELITQHFSQKEANHFGRNVLHILSLSTLPNRYISRKISQEKNFHNRDFRTRFGPIIKTYRTWINFQDIDGMTPLMYATHNPPLFEKLLQYGAQTTFKDKRGWPLKVHVYLSDNPETKRIYRQYTRDYAEVSLDDIFYQKTTLIEQLRKISEHKDRPLSSHQDYNLYLKHQIQNKVDRCSDKEDLTMFLSYWARTHEVHPFSLKGIQDQKEFNQKFTSLLEAKQFHHCHWTNTFPHETLEELVKDEKVIPFLNAWAVSLFLSHYPHVKSPFNTAYPEKDILDLAAVIIKTYSSSLCTYWTEFSVDLIVQAIIEKPSLYLPFVPFFSSHLKKEVMHHLIQKSFFKTCRLDIPHDFLALLMDTENKLPPLEIGYDRTLTGYSFAPFVLALQKLENPLDVCESFLTYVPHLNTPLLRHSFLVDGFKRIFEKTLLDQKIPPLDLLYSERAQNIMPHLGDILIPWALSILSDPHEFRKVLKEQAQRIFDFFKNEHNAIRFIPHKPYLQHLMDACIQDEKGLVSFDYQEFSRDDSLR